MFFATSSPAATLSSRRLCGAVGWPFITPAPRPRTVTSTSVQLTAPRLRTAMTRVLSSALSIRAPTSGAGAAAASRTHESFTDDTPLRSPTHKARQRRISESSGQEVAALLEFEVVVPECAMWSPTRTRSSRMPSGTTAKSLCWSPNDPPRTGEEAATMSECVLAQAALISGYRELYARRLLFDATIRGLDDASTSGPR